MLVSCYVSATLDVICQMLTGDLHCVGKVNGVETSGCTIRRAPRAGAGPEG